jgi:hypothetical protein
METLACPVAPHGSAGVEGGILWPALLDYLECAQREAHTNPEDPRDSRPVRDPRHPRWGIVLFDPIFQGLAISLMAGEVASLLLSRVTVPVLYYLSRRRSLPQTAVASAA